MYCKKCGNQLSDADKFCKNCGEPIGETKVETTTEPVQPSVQPAPTQPTGNKDNKMLIIIACIIVAAALIVGGIFLLQDRDKDKNKKPKENNVNEFEDTNDIVPDIIDDDNNVKTDVNDDDNDIKTDVNDDNNDVKTDVNDDNDVQTTSDSITYKKFKFNKISGYTYSVGSSGLQITNSSNAIVLDIVAGNFDLVKTQREKLNETFEKQGYTIKNTQLKTYGGTEYISAEVSKSGMDMIILYTKANDSYTYVIGLANKSYTVDYSMVYTANSIIKNASYVG